jgi:hypothetical protein
MRALTAVPDFWTLAPKSAALDYVLRNRPPSVRSECLTTIVDAGDVAPPEAGDLTLTDGPSGCFAPSGAFVHHLHCSPVGSFLIRAEYVGYLRQLPPTEGHSKFEFRKIDLPYEAAKHLLQTVWWMSRVRTRVMEGWGGGGMTSTGSTSDGHAVVHLVSGDQRLTVSATRAAGHTGTFLGLGEYGSDYDPCAFINLAVQLFAREAPEHFGAAWKSQAIPDSWENVPITPEQIAATKAKAAEMLRLYADGLVDAGVASVAVAAVGENGWRDLREDLERAARVVPPLRPHELQLTEIDAQIADWVKKLGPEANREGQWERERRRYAREQLARLPGGTPDPTAAVPGLDLEPVPPPPSPEDLKFAEVDALHRARGETEYDAPPPDRAIAELRQTIATAHQQLDWFDDPQALFAWAQRDIMISDFALARLVKLDRPLTLKLLRWLEEKEEHPGSKERYTATRIVLEEQPPADDPGEKPAPRQLTAEDIATEVATLLTAGATVQARIRALDLLVPAEDPHRHKDPAIDAALLELLSRDPTIGDARPAELPIAAARRLGSKAWEPLVAYPEQASAIGVARLSTVTPALLLIARREPDPWRDRLRERLREEFKASYGYLDDTLWCLWLIDARDLAPELQRLATRGPEDYESIHGTGGTNHRLPPKHRLHRARHLLALWSEKDPFTRTRALLAFAATSADAFDTHGDASAERLRSEIATAARELTSEQIERLRAFARWCEDKAAPAMRRPPSPENLKKVTGVFRAALQRE